MALIDLPLVHPDRKTSGFRPLKVLHHFRKLVEDKEDTEQVFHIIEALKGKKGHRQGWEFIRSSEGQRMMRENINLPAMLDNHERWADCGPNGVAQHYMKFMQREGLSAAGLVAESHKWQDQGERLQDQTEWYFERLRDTHDLLHVLTSYNRDGLGEAALLGFSYEQNHNLSVLFIAYAGTRQRIKETQTKAPLFDAVREGRDMGKAAAKIAHEDIEALMREDIDEARKRLSIAEPVIYRQCIAQMIAEGTADDDMRMPEEALAA